MKPELEQTLSRLADGEMVDPEALAAALAEPDAAETLVEYARVHHAVLDEAERPSDAFYEKMHAQLAPRRRRGAWRMPLAAAALVVLSVLGGMWVGSSIVPPRTIAVPVAVHAPEQPTPSAVVDPTVAVPPFLTQAAQRPVCGPAGPPRPSRIIQLTPVGEPRPGVAAGGNRP